MRVESLYPKGKLCLRELGLRDGLQLTSSWPSTEAKRKWIRRAHAAGVNHFEIGSFLPVKSFPQFSDIREIIEFVDALPRAYSSALTMNERAITDALQTRVDEIVVSISSTEEHSQANIRRSRSDAVGLLAFAAAERGLSSHGPVINAAISMAFGCSIRGNVAPEEVERLAIECVKAGAEVIGIADTVGFAGPRQITEMCSMLERGIPDIPKIIHLHDTRGTGIANASAALDAGIRILDGTLGGLGGCPFAPGATGNVVFEDLVFLCERSGFDTGIDIERLIEVREIIEDSMPEEALHGALARAGTPSGIHWRAIDPFDTAKTTGAVTP